MYYWNTGLFADDGPLYTYVDIPLKTAVSFSSVVICSETYFNVERCVPD